MSVLQYSRYMGVSSWVHIIITTNKAYKAKKALLQLLLYYNPMIQASNSSGAVGVVFRFHDHES